MSISRVNDLILVEKQHLELNLAIFFFTFLDIFSLHYKHELEVDKAGVPVNQNLCFYLK